MADRVLLNVCFKSPLHVTLEDGERVFRRVFGIPGLNSGFDQIHLLQFSGVRIGTCGGHADRENMGWSEGPWGHVVYGTVVKHSGASICELQWWVLSNSEQCWSVELFDVFRAL